MANPLFDQIQAFILGLLNQNKTVIVDNVQKQVVAEIAKPVAEVEVKEGIDWTDGTQKVSDHFTVHEMLYLPTWKRMAVESDGLDATVKANLVSLAKAMDVVRDYFGKSINVHVTYRPLEYNKVIHGALHSAHSVGLAMDFDVAGMSCGDATRQMIKDGKLEEWGMRCENNGEEPTWIHLDLRAVPEGGHRYFKP
jgi:hypothetical protein